MFTYGYYTAGRALVKGLEAVDGDVSDQSALQAALADVTLSGDEAPYGDVKLDDNRQAISDIYVKKIVKDTNGDGVPDVKTFRRIPGRRPDVRRLLQRRQLRRRTARTRSARRATPPPWVGNAEEVSFGG